MRFPLAGYLLHLLLAFTSCVNLAARKVGLLDNGPGLERLQVPGKEVYFLGMMHLARPAFYDNVRRAIDTLQQQGYIFYVESVSGYGPAAPVPDTLALRKFRKVLALSPGRPYSGQDNPLFGKMTTQLGLVDQPRYDSLGIRNYRWVDHSVANLVRIFEFKHGTIALDSCDLNTPVGAPFPCGSFDLGRARLFLEDVGLYERNRLLAQTLRESADKKIVVVYGKGHLEGLRQELADSTSH